MKRHFVKIPDVLFFQEGPGIRNTQYTNDGVKLLNVANLVDGKLELSTSDRYISEKEAYGKYKHFLCDTGDFVVASSGIKVDYIDKKMGFVEDFMLPLCMNTSTIRFKVLNPDILRIIPNKIYNDKKIEILNNLSFEQDFLKTRTIIPKENPFYHNREHNMTISEIKRKYFDIYPLKIELNNIDKTAKRFNQNFLTKIKFGNKGSGENKKRLNINIFKSNNNDDANDIKYYEDENNKNFIKNKKYFNRYIKKFSHFKYNNNLINKFFESKKDDIDNVPKYLPKMKRKIEENDDEYYYLREKDRIQKKPILKKIKIIKKRFKEQVDKEIFNIFNKKI